MYYVSRVLALVLGKSVLSKVRNKEFKADQEQIYERNEHREEVEVLGGLWMESSMKIFKL